MNPEHSFAFKVVGHQKIAVEKLHAHKAAMRPIDEEDKAVLADSVKNFGVIEDPIVMKSGDGWAILSGCNRVRDAKAAGLAEIICKVIETDNPAAFVSELLCGRKKTSSQRILSYLELNADIVLETHDSAEERQTAGLKKGQKPQCFSVGANAPTGENQAGFWTSRGIAERLHCDHKDVDAGINLLFCLKNPAALHEAAKASIHRDHDVKRTPEQIDAAFKDTVFEIRCGATGLRRWQAAMMGRLTTENAPGGKLPTDFFDLAQRSAVSLASVFRNWHNVSHKNREHVLIKWREAVDVAPPDFLYGAALAATAKLPANVLRQIRDECSRQIKERPS